MSGTYTEAVERLSRVAGVRGALIVDRDTMVPVVAEVSEDVNGTAASALAASLYARSRQAVGATGFGDLSTVQLEADEGHVLALDAGEVILVVIAHRDAPIGLIRLEARRAAEALA